MTRIQLVPARLIRRMKISTTALPETTGFKIEAKSWPLMPNRIVRIRNSPVKKEMRNPQMIPCGTFQAAFGMLYAVWMGAS